MTYIESEIIIKEVDVERLIVERKKAESDIRLNNPDLLRAVVTFTSISVRDRLLKIA